MLSIWKKSKILSFGKEFRVESNPSLPLWSKHTVDLAAPDIYIRPTSPI